MKKLYETIILIGFVTFFMGGVITVLGQFTGVIIGNPAFVVFLEQVSGFIFPIASVSGLLCFLYPYLFKKSKKTS